MSVPGGGGVPAGRGERGLRDGRDGGGEPGESHRVPWLSMILMAVFVAGGSAGLLIEWPPGPGNLDWGVWVVLYGGYAFVIGAAFLHARTGR